MTGICKMTKKETQLPCSASNCPLFGDCLVEYEKTVRKPMTNADRIRAMSDMELAKIFTQTVADGCPPDMDWTCKKDEEGWDACDNCWLKWLQQPAEVESDGKS